LISGKKQEASGKSEQVDSVRITDSFNPTFSQTGPTVIVQTLTADHAVGPSTGRPKIVFDRWGQIPANHPEARLLSVSVVGQFLQNGFHFINEGERAYDVTVESFKFGSFEARSKPVTHIGKEGGFALVWIAQAQPVQSAHSPDTWDLPAAMALAAIHAHPSSAVYRQDYTVPVSVTYRDGNDAESRLWYRSSATLAYIPSQKRLDFRDITHEKGSPTRPS
jgi:hypothetical protein